MLETSSGTIIQNSGSFSAFRSASRSNNTSVATEDSSTAANTESQGIEELASMVWGFVKSAGGLVQGLDVEVCRNRTVMREYKSDSIRMRLNSYVYERRNMSL